ncbi:MAG: Eco57I restriction-modification methylase domain-containing protein [Candidatus Hodarchaeota archaeon]
MYYKSSIIVKRKRHGQFFTHPAIAKHIVQEICHLIIFERLWKKLESLDKNFDPNLVRHLLDEVFALRFVDPAMGDGIFLLEIMDYFERFLWELWEKTHSSMLFKPVSQYFKQKVAINFSLVGIKDPQTFDIWKFHVFRTMIYGVDLDAEVVEQAYHRFIAKFSTPSIVKLVKTYIPFNLKLGNSLISPIKMDEETKSKLLSQFSYMINNLLTSRILLHKLSWDHISEESLTHTLSENELIKTKIVADVSKHFSSLSEFKNSFFNERTKNNSFIWEIEFPEAFFSEKYGFDVVLGNPPWEKWKLYNREWLGSTSLSNTEYAQKIMHIRKYDSQADIDYLKLKNFYYETSKYFNHYYQWQPGEKNLYKLFLERFYTLCCSGGHLGIILPGGLLGEYYSQPLRSMLLKKARIHLISEIISNYDIFPDVEPGLSILILLVQKINSSDNFPFIKGINSTKSLSSISLQDLSRNPDNIIYFSCNDIIQDSPKLIIPAIRNQSELNIVRKMVKFSSLSSKEWGCKTSRGIDMTNDRHMLVKQKTPYPLVEGRHLVRLGYDSTYPRYWIQSIEKYKARIPFWDEKIIVWKNFSGNHRRRRMRVAVLPPKTAISNSVICLYRLPKISGIEFYLTGIMCSIPFEFRIRQLCYGLNINQYVIDGITIPLFDPKQHYHQKMVNLVREFIPRGKEWARRKLEASSSLSKAQLEIIYQDTITEIDALAALIYKLSKQEFETTLKAHPLLEESYCKKALNHFDMLIDWREC